MKSDLRKITQLLSFILARQNRFALILCSVMIVTIVGAMGSTYIILHNKETAQKNVAAKNLLNATNQETYTDLSGKSFDISEYTKKSVVVTSWASWCPQCATELELLNSIMMELGDTAVPVLAINRREPNEVALRYISSLPQLSRVSFIVDTTDNFFGAVEGYAMPETIVYNEDGEKIFHGRGNSDGEVLRSTINSLQSN